MGHTQISRLPRTQKWRAVVELLASPDLVVGGLGGANCLIMTAAERRLLGLRGDPSLTYCFWLLVRLAEAARGPDFVDGARVLGVPARPDDSALAFVARVTDTARGELDRFPQSGPFGELASLALRRALTETVGTEGRSLFGSSLDDLETAFRRHASPVQFGELSVRFFGDFFARTVRFYAEREVANAMGGGALASVDDVGAFSRALDLHARETARIVESFAADWYSKHHWEAGGAIGREEAGRFVAHALRKLRAEFRRGGA